MSEQREQRHVELGVTRGRRGLRRVVLIDDAGLWRISWRDGSGDATLDADYDALRSFDPSKPADHERLMRLARLTTPEPEPPPPPPRLSDYAEHRAPRPTAANPRAFVGTKAQPPTSARRRLDARPHVSRVAHLIPHAADPYLAMHHPGAPKHVDPATFDASFVPAFMLLRGTRWPAVLAASSAWRWLSRADERVPAMVLRAGIRWGATGVRVFLDALALLSREQRMPFAAALLSARIPSLPEESVPAIARAAALGGDEWIWERFAAHLAVGHAPACIAGAIEIADMGRGAHGPTLLRPAERDIAPWVRAVTPAFQTCAQDSPSDSLHRIVARLPGADEMIEALARTEGLSTSERREWLRAVEHFSSAAPELFSAARPFLRAALEGALQNPTSSVGQGAMIREMVFVGLYGRSRPKVTHDDLALISLVRPRDREVLALLMGLADALGRPPELGRDDVVRLATRWPRGRREWVALSGVHALAKAWPEHVESMLARHPRATLRLCSRLGLVPQASVIRVLREVRKDARFTPPESEDDAPLTLAASSPDSPVPRALREYVEGKRELKPGQIARHLRITGARWDLFRIRLADRALADHLGVSPEHSETERFARILHARTGRYRRTFRRFLPRWLEGEDDAVFAHPATRAWLRRHPDLNEKRWREGVRAHVDAGPHGEVELAVERNPLEALRLGVVADTCLAPGGICDEDAPGIVLEPNRRVVYARDATGQRIARQIVAYTEGGRLVAHPVYPEPRRRRARPRVRALRYRLRGRARGGDGHARRLRAGVDPRPSPLGRWPLEIDFGSPRSVDAQPPWCNAGASSASRTDPPGLVAAASPAAPSDPTPSRRPTRPPPRASANTKRPPPARPHPHPTAGAPSGPNCTPRSRSRPWGTN